MRQEKKELTEDERYEQELQLEQDLARYTRTYTILDRNRAQFSSGRGGGAIARQRRVLSIFRREQRNILTDLHVASAAARRREDDRRSRRLQALLAEHDAFDEEIDVHRAHMGMIEAQIKMVKKKVLELCAQQISDEKYQERHVKGEKTLQTLENKLEVQVKKFNEISASNVGLREEINHLLIERKKFNKMWNRLIKNLHMGKKFMLDLIEQATIAYDQREEWVSKLQFVRVKAHNDLLAHVQEMRILQRKADNDAKLQQFFAVKGQKRVLRDLESKERTRRARLKEHTEKNLNRYLQILCAIMEFEGEERVQDIAKRFLVDEEENFSMFKYVNHLNREMEDLSDGLCRLHAEIDEAQALNDARAEHQEANLGEMRRSSEGLGAELATKRAELEGVDRDLGSIVKGVGELFRMFKCRNDPLLQLLGHNETINNHSVLLYLEILDTNVQEYLVTVYRNEKVDHKKAKSDQRIVYEAKTAYVVHPLEDFVKSSPCPLCVENELVSDVIDELQFALGKDQVQARLREIDSTKGLVGKVHNVSACHLPKSRQIIQKRYQ